MVKHSFRIVANGNELPVLWNIKPCAKHDLACCRPQSYTDKNNVGADVQHVSQVL